MPTSESRVCWRPAAESLVPRLRRLRPVDIVKTLDRSARLELDLRLEAAAISEMSENIKDDRGFRIPRVYWDHGATDVLTTSWVDGIPVRDLAALDAAGVDRKELARNLLQSFLRHAMRDGYFHADLHPGNLFANPATSEIIAVDFGIMGRLGNASDDSSPKSSMASSRATIAGSPSGISRSAMFRRTSRSTSSHWRCGRSASRCMAARPRTSK